jgi:GT2 family glycosyltransferase
VPDVCIIIVSWNAQHHLVNCLNSLQRLKGYTQEIIVVDNGSTDGSCEAVEKEFPQVKLIRNHENLGFARANNIGIKAGSGKHVALVNSDIVVLGDCIKKMIEFMDRNPSVGMAGPRVLNADRTLQVSCRHFPSVWNNLCQTIGLNKVFPKTVFFSEPLMKYWAHDQERKVDVLSGCFWMTRSAALDEVGLLDEDFFFYGEDIDWCRRFHEAKWEVVFYPEAEAIHFGGASSSNAPIRFNLEMQKADLQYWRKHHGKSGELIYWMIILLRQLVRIPVFALMYVFRAKNRETARFKLKRAFACICFLFGFNIDK